MSDRRVILVVCDGLRADMVSDEFCPHIFGLKKCGAWFANHRSVFPSVTRPASSSIATGCRPDRHGLHGNTMVLVHSETARVHDAGDPAFPRLMRRATGTTLRVPTLAQRLAAEGGTVVMSNVSPGGAYFQDPEGCGCVYHRAGSYGPGLNAVPPGDRLAITPDGAGDREMTGRFCQQVLLRQRPRLAVLWLCEPDHTGHRAPLGSPAHLAAIRCADYCVAQVLRTIEALKSQGETILCLVGSDHGQETVREVIALDRELVKAGLKRGIESDDVLIAPQGSAALIYLRDNVRSRLDAIHSFLAAQPWAGRVMAGDGLRQIGLPARYGLSLAVSMAKSAEANQFGVPGLTDCGVSGEGLQLAGRGQHGGLGLFEQSPFLIAWGPGFQEGGIRNQESKLTDIAPTILQFLGFDHSDMDGRPLQEDKHPAAKRTMP